MEVLLLLMVFLVLVYIVLRRPKPIGTIVITDDDYMYVVLKDTSAMDKIKTSKQVTFDISHK